MIPMKTINLLKQNMQKAFDEIRLELKLNNKPYFELVDVQSFIREPMKSIDSSTSDYTHGIDVTINYRNHVYHYYLICYNLIRFHEAFELEDSFICMPTNDKLTIVPFEFKLVDSYYDDKVPQHEIPLRTKIQNNFGLNDDMYVEERITELKYFKKLLYSFAKETLTEGFIHEFTQECFTIFKESLLSEKRNNLLLNNGVQVQPIDFEKSLIVFNDNMQLKVFNKDLDAMLSVHLLKDAIKGCSF